MSKEFEYDPESGSFRFDEGDKTPKKKDGGDIGSWIIIAALFAFGLWPIGLIALISKLSDKPKKASAPRSGMRTSTSPNANVTREQMAAILYRYAQYKKYNTAASSSLNGFTDYATVSGYAVTPMQWSVAEKLINGNAGKLMPTGNATRAQVAAILHRFVENVATTK